MPSYQHAAFVGEAVGSALAQTVQNIEVIVVDDASTDGTPDVVEAIGDSRVRLVRHTRNRRLHARNTALSLARGEYVAFLNSDDVWAPTKLERQLEVFRARPDIGLCFTGVRMMLDTKVLDVRSSFDDGSKIRTPGQWLRTLVERTPFCISSGMARHELLRQVGPFRVLLQQRSDHDMWVRLAAVSGVHVIPELLTQMRVRVGHNLGGTPRARSLQLIELADVLENYAKQPLLGRLPSIFPDLPLDPQGEPLFNLVQVVLALARLSLGHKLSADRVLSRLIDDPESRERLLTAFGPQLLQLFWENRTALSGQKID